MNTNKTLRILTAVAAAILVGTLSAPASAKTRAACIKEWQANKAANQAAGTTEKAYVAQCRGTPAPTANTPPAGGGESGRSY